MSHQVRLTLRPPPNVDFVHGYPGIPPGADRPQAAVKGAIEIRVPPQGVRAKWVRIELRKVETLPGGGTTNTFYDYVGPTPLNLWQAPEGDYGTLRTGDFQFSIRIPESIPPSIALENRAGINYELVASVCVKGKKGFFRRSKSSVVSTTSQILIDKHELHSTWPIYTQPESRSMTTPEGVTLIVERRNTCYGPGDRITVSATIKSDALHTIILRGFELILKESSVFRPGAFAQGKKSAPQAKMTVVSEAKFAVNATIYGGMGHKSELACGLSADHTTTTLNAARHIDVTYTVVVRALMGTGQPVVMELPVVISNWQRHVSMEAIRRIGPAPGLSLLPPQHSGHQGHTHNASITRVDPAPRGANTLPTSRTQGVIDVRANTVGGVSSPMSMSKGLPDEFGYGVGYSSNNNNTNTTATGNTTLTKVKTHQSTGSRSSTEDYRAASNTVTTPAKGGRPTSSRSTSAPQHRFTITNLGAGEIPEDTEREMRERLMQSEQRAEQRDTRPRERERGEQRWPTAEEEKLRLYENARAKAERTQGGVAPPPARPITPPVHAPIPVTPPMQHPAPKPKSSSAPWPSAEEEKMRLFNQAQAAVQRAQGVSATPSPPPANRIPSPASNHNRSNSKNSGSGPNANTSEYFAGGSKGAALYSAAMASRIANGNAANLPATPPQLKIQTGAQQSPARSPPVVPQYPTAEQEKAALRRYEEAKRAVDRTQGGEGAPVAYDALYPGQGSQQQQQADLPPPFESTSGIPPAHLSEKERMRREYEARDAAARLGRSDSANAPIPAPAAHNGYSYPGGYVQYESAPGYTSPSPPPMPEDSHLPPPFAGGPSQAQYTNAMAEKEALRRKFEAQDRVAAMNTNNGLPQPPPARVASPPRSGGGRAALPRPTPQPPVAGGSGVLTAAEEKALLRARYAAEENSNSSPRNKPVYTNGLTHSPPRAGSSTAPPSPVQANGGGIPPPPPLMPRPPVEYIQETQEVDARISRYANSDEVPPLDEPPSVPMLSPLPQGQQGRLPEIRPFTPFNAAFGDSLKTPQGSVPPPPLPPKPAGE